MSWLTLLVAMVIEGVAVVGLLRGTAPPSAVAVAHVAATLLVAIAVANAIPGARGRAVAVVAAVPALVAPPFGVVVAPLLLLLVPATPAEIESTWDDLPAAADAEGGIGTAHGSPQAPAAARAASLAEALETGAAIDALRFGEPAQRRAAAQRLSEIDDPTTLAALRWAAQDGDPEVARHARAGLARAEGRVNREILGAREVLRRDPLSPLVNAALGDHYSEYADLGVLDSTTRRHYLEMAVKTYARALELSREQIPDLFLSIGAALTSLGRHKVALTFLDRAVQARPSDPRPLVRRTEALVRMGRIAQAVTGCRRARRLGIADKDLAAIAAYWAAAKGADDEETAPGRAPEPVPEVPFSPWDVTGGMQREVAALAAEATDAGLRAERIEAELTSIFARLSSPLAYERAAAYRSLLAYQSEAAIDVVWRLLPDATETAKAAACRWLGHVGGARAVRRLGVLLSAPEDAVRREAAAMLERAEGPGKVETLIRALESGSVFARTYAARAAATSGERRTVRALIDNLDDPRLEVREAAIAALARLRDKRAVPALARQMEDGRPELRLAAVLALADLADRRATGTLALACKDQNGAVRHGAVFSLARTAGGRAIPALVRALENDVDPSVRQEAARRLGDLAAAEAARPGVLRRLVGTGRIEKACVPLVRAAALDRALVVRAAARCALDVVPPEAIFDPVARAIADPDPRVRHAAATKLGRLSPGVAAGRAAEAAAEATARAALPLLVSALAKDPNAAVRAGSADALGRLGGTLAAAEGNPAILALEGALCDDEESVVGAAAAALGRLMSGHELLFLAKRVGETGTPAPGAKPSPLAAQAFLRLVQEVARREPIPEQVLLDTIRALENASTNVRYLAALALEKTRRAEAGEPLLRLATRDQIASIRATAARGVAAIQRGDPSWLLDRIARPARDEEHHGVKAYERDRAILLAVAAMDIRRDLLSIATERLLLLAPGLRERGSLPECEPEYLACFRAAPGELARLVGSAAGRRSADDSDPLPGRVRAATLAARVLGKLGREGVSIPDRAELREALGSTDAGLRRAAALALGDLKDGEAVASLVLLAGKDKEPEIRAAARHAVSRILAAPGMDPDEDTMRGQPRDVAAQAPQAASTASKEAPR